MKLQIDAQRGTMLIRHEGESLEAKENMTKKNHLLNAALDENRNLTERNVQLEDELFRLQSEMKEGEIEIKKTTDEYLRFEQLLKQHDDTADARDRENSLLKGQIEDLLKQIRSKADSDDEIMSHVDEKVREWTGILAEKDDTILHLQRQVMKMREDLVAANMDSGKKSVEVLSKALDERDKQIEMLSSQLKATVTDLHDNAALLDDVRARVVNAGGGPTDATRKKITSQQSAIKQLEEQLLVVEKRTAEAETDAREKDKELNEIHEKMSLYEQGRYGLPEAVHEIKQCKVQVRERDRTIEELTQYINRCEIQMNELYDEAEELRERLGLDPKEPINLSDIRHKKAIHLQQDRALNRVLHKEIENLEEERINLKLQMRNLAQMTGQKAVAMGLTADQVAAVDSFIDQIKATNDSSIPKAFMLSLQANNKTNDKRINEKVVRDDFEKSAKRINSLHEECTELKTKNDALVEENILLEKGFIEIKQQLTSGSNKHGGEPLICTSLDKMLAVFESRSIVGRYDKSVILKAQVDNLTGCNEELRRELRECRVDIFKVQDQLGKTNGKNDSLELEVKALREARSIGWHQTTPLPEGMTVSTAELIASLNEHLVVALHELSVREDIVEKVEEGLETYKRKFAIMRHQQGLLYEEHRAEKKKWEQAEEKSKLDFGEFQGARKEDQIKIEEFNRLLDTLSQAEPDVQRRLVEMSRKMTVLRVNEEALTRRYTATQDMLHGMQKEITRLNGNVIASQKSIAERLGYLQRHKDMMSFKVCGLQKALEDSVPASQLDIANKQFMELTEKYRNLLESSKSLVAHTEESSGYQVEVKRLQEESNALRKELEIDKEKLHTLQVTFEEIHKHGVPTSSNSKPNDSDLLSLAHRLTTLEMKELNERQRADHASGMYEQQKTSIRQLEDRNFDLESKFAELTRINLDQQKVDRCLRDELANSVLKSVSDMDRKHITELEQTEAVLINEVSKLKEVSDVATMQVHEIQTQQQSHDKELTSLRQQLLDIQIQSDEKTVIGKLHRHIIQLQVSEGTAIRRCEEAAKRLAKLEAHSLRLEHRNDEKDQTIYHNRQESRNKQSHLKQTIQELRRKYAGAVPLADQEKFAHLMFSLQENKKITDVELGKAKEERLKVEDKLAEMNLQHKGLEELMATLKDGKGAQKVADWHSKMEIVRLEDLRYKRDIERLKRQLKFIESVCKMHESEVLSLEEDRVRLKKDFESSELTWEQREVELERTILKLEKQQCDIANAASQFEDAIGTLPDSSLPIIQQLDHAVTTIRRNVKIIIDTKSQMHVYKKRVEELEEELKSKDRELLSRDRIITDLRLRLPASAERDALFANVSIQKLSKPQDQDYENNQGVRIAHATVSSLQVGKILYLHYIYIRLADMSLASYAQGPVFGSL